MIDSSLKGPFPPRKATEVLCGRLVEQLELKQPEVGSPFYSESELAKASGLSRFTVRRAMTRLSEQGWIERRAGKGTFIGPRVLVGQEPKRKSSTKKHMRLAVLVFALDNAVPDWYSSGILQGIDEVAEDLSLSIELMGDSSADPAALTRRLEQSRPDALAVMPSRTRHAFMIREAQRLGIPCVLTGTRMLDLRMPTVCEDGIQGAALAVRHLYENGHRRIALLQRPDTASWVFERREGYVQGIAECGLDLDERLVCWLTNDAGPDSSRRLARFLQKMTPTAMLISSRLHVQTLGRLIKEEPLQIPQDLSVITFDQDSRMHQLHAGVKLATVNLPLQQMGRQLASLAYDMVHEGKADTEVRIPCEINPGDSVRDISRLK